jgi:hypothetical protein
MNSRFEAIESSRVLEGKMAVWQNSQSKVFFGKRARHKGGENPPGPSFALPIT